VQRPIRRSFNDNILRGNNSLPASAFGGLHSSWAPPAPVWGGDQVVEQQSYFTDHGIVSNAGHWLPPPGPGGFEAPQMPAYDDFESRPIEMGPIAPNFQGMQPTYSDCLSQTNTIRTPHTYARARTQAHTPANSYSQGLNPEFCCASDLYSPLFHASLLGMSSQQRGLERNVDLDTCKINRVHLFSIVFGSSHFNLVSLLCACIIYKGGVWAPGGRGAARSSIVLLRNLTQLMFASSFAQAEYYLPPPVEIFPSPAREYFPSPALYPPTSPYSSQFRMDSAYSRTINPPNQRRVFPSEMYPVRNYAPRPSYQRYIRDAPRGAYVGQYESFKPVPVQVSYLHARHQQQTRNVFAPRSPNLTRSKLPPQSRWMQRTQYSSGFAGGPPHAHTYRTGAAQPYLQRYHASPHLRSLAQPWPVAQKSMPWYGNPVPRTS